MCLVVLAYKVHPRYPLIVAANRDEFLDRPAKPLHFWEDAPHILAGRDERAGGTWMGLSRAGRFAALTNYRDMRRPEVQGPSRGALVRQAMEPGVDLPDTRSFAGFNLIHGRYDALLYHNNVDGQHSLLEPGIHGLSNHLLNTPWPKVERAKKGMEVLLRSSAPLVDDLFELLADAEPAPDNALPDTGIGLPWERVLSSIRIQAEGYGTRCSSVLMVDENGLARFVERGFDPRSERDHTLFIGDDAVG